MSYVGFATLLFGGLADKCSKTFSFLRENLRAAEIRMSFRSYVSATFLTTILTYFLSAAFLYFYFSFMIPIPFPSNLLYIFSFSSVFSLICFLALLFSPYQRKQWRKRNIETNLPFALTHMGAIAEAGVPPSLIFRLISKFEEYGELAKEMKKVVRNMDIFGLDPLRAVREVAKRTPSQQLRQVLMGLVTTIQSGGDVRTYLKNAGERSLFEWRIRRQRFVQQLTTYAEFYTGLLIAAPLFIISLFAVMNLVPGARTIGGFEILNLMELSIYIILPVLNTGFLMLLKGVEVEM